jgi:hypothetical protein
LLGALVCLALGRPGHAELALNRARKRLARMME